MGFVFTFASLFLTKKPNIFSDTISDEKRFCNDSTVNYLLQGCFVVNSVNNATVLLTFEIVVMTCDDG